MKLRARSLRRMLPVFCCFVACAQYGPARHRSSRSGDFDHYRLSLSWSPEYCYDHRASAECSGPRHYGFIVHGLWPEYREARGPEYCSPSAPPPEYPPELLDIMPDRHLIQHEWRAHGTCTGLPSLEYFQDILAAFRRIHIPREFAAPAATFVISPEQIKRAFLESNPGLTPAALTITCRREYLTSVEICLDRSLHPTACPVSRDCTARRIRVAPVR